jgi:hypothetical protein
VSESAIPLERDATGVLWRRTLSQIPSSFGRMAWLASLRNPHSGVYEHHGLAVLFGPEGSNKALRLSHLACCREWLNTSIEEQMADLRLYIDSQSGSPGEIIGNWRELGFWRTILPASIRGAERAMYLANVEALLTLLQNEAAGGVRRSA